MSIRQPTGCGLNPPVQSVRRQAGSGSRGLACRKLADAGHVAATGQHVGRAGCRSAEPPVVFSARMHSSRWRTLMTMAATPAWPGQGQSRWQGVAHGCKASGGIGANQSDLGSATGSTRAAASGRSQLPAPGRARSDSSSELTWGRSYGSCATRWISRPPPRRRRPRCRGSRRKSTWRRLWISAPSTPRPGRHQGVAR